MFWLSLCYLCCSVFVSFGGLFQLVLELRPINTRAEGFEQTSEAAVQIELDSNSKRFQIELPKKMN